MTRCINTLWYKFKFLAFTFRCYAIRDSLTHRNSTSSRFRLRVYRKGHNFLVHYIGSNYRAFRRRELTVDGKRQPRATEKKQKQPPKKQYEDPLDFSNFRLHSQKPATTDFTKVGPFFAIPPYAKLSYADLSEIFDRLWQSKQICHDNILDITKSVIVDPKAGDLYAFNTDNMKGRSTWSYYVKEDTYHWKGGKNVTQMTIDGRIFQLQKCTAYVNRTTRYSARFKKYATQDLERKIVLIHYMGNEKEAMRF